MNFDPATIRYNAAQTSGFYKVLVERARSVPGVKSVALASNIPLSTNFAMDTVVPEGYQFPRGQESVSVWSSAVDENFFGTLGIGILRGRGIQRSDRSDTPQVAVVNEVFAQRYCPGTRSAAG